MSEEKPENNVNGYLIDAALEALGFASDEAVATWDITQIEYALREHSNIPSNLIAEAASEMLEHGVSLAAHYRASLATAAELSDMIESLGLSRDAMRVAAIPRWKPTTPDNPYAAGEIERTASIHITE